jgi:AcrR family transcriptional regulator
VAYEATKRIKGRAYRYRIEGYRDLRTGRPRKRWHYVGRVLQDGAIAAPSSHWRRASREQIAAATVDLLKTRDPSRVTVSVIARQAGISTATFYRYFPNRYAAFAAALTCLADRTFRNMTLDGPLGKREEEARRVSGWLDGLQRAVLGQRAFRWSFTTAEGSIALARIDRSSLKHDTQHILAAYLSRLHRAGLARVADPLRLAESIIRICVAFNYFTANNEHNPDRLDFRLSDAFPVIERAIFGSLLELQRPPRHPESLKSQDS